MTEKELEELSSAIHDYEKQSNNYHFYNWEVEELDRCEKAISNIVYKYADNVSILNIILAKLKEMKTRYIPRQLIEEIQRLVDVQQDTMSSFISFDGQKFATMEEAEARNQLIRDVAEKHNKK